MDKCLLIQSKFEDTSFPKKVDLIVSSPPYGIGKSYEGFETLENYISWAERIVPLLKQHLNPKGAVVGK
jgi:adenine-specific DNA-methyltransferase